MISDLLQAGAKLKPRDEDGNALENARKQVGLRKGRKGCTWPHGCPPATRQARSSDMDRIVRMLEKAFDERGATTFRNF